MVERVESIVIGAGAVGLAVARSLARAGREVIVLESAETIGTGTSSRNSEVIHAGIYYQPGSLKARLCVEGRRMLYAYLAERRVDHLRCEKLIVATSDDELPRIKQLHDNGRANGVEGLEMLSAEAALKMEPGLRCLGALRSAETGILDSHGYMLALRGDAENAGAAFAFLSPATGGRIEGDGVVIAAGSGADAMELKARLVVNCAGLGAQTVAGAIAGVREKSVPPLHYAKGNYFLLSGPAPFERLIYPAPGQASLGLHYTRDLAGQGRFGPDVEWVDRIDYTVDPGRAGMFEDAIRRYWPDLPEGALAPGYAGIRPKIQAPGEPARDFAIDDGGIEDGAGLLNLFGIESPGLTASMAIAGEVMKRLV